MLRNTSWYQQKFLSLHQHLSLKTLKKENNAKWAMSALLNVLKVSDCCW